MLRRAWLTAVLVLGALSCGCSAPVEVRADAPTPSTTSIGGPKVEIVVPAGALTAGSTVGLVVHVAGPTGGVDGGWMLDLGDGRIVEGGYDRQWTGGCPKAGENWSPAPTDAVDVRYDVPWGYRTAGTFHLVARARVGYCGDGQSVEGRADVAVAPGPPHGNGPNQPTVLLGLALPPPATATTVHSWDLPDQELTIADPDGWISRVDVDWGDGSHAVLDAPAGPCHDPVTTWPRSFVRVRHSYKPTPAPRRPPQQDEIRATVVSAACDGTDEQHATWPPYPAFRFPDQPVVPYEQPAVVA